MSRAQALLDETRAYAAREFIPILSEDCERVLCDLVARLQPRCILEIGTAIGYSAARMALACDARIDTIERDEARIAYALRLWKDLGVDERIRLHRGDANEILPSVVRGARYDLVFLDGPKSRYGEQLDVVMPALSAGSVVVCDDVHYFGYVTSGEYPPHKHRTIVCKMRAFLERIRCDERMRAQIYDQGNGIAVITIR